MSVYGGGGPRGRGSVPAPAGHRRRPHRRDRRDPPAEWLSSSSGRTCPGSTTGRTSGRAPGSPAAASPAPRSASPSGARSGTLADAGASLVRWWLLGDGRAGLVEDDDGRLSGLDDRFFPDVDAALEALRAEGLLVQFVVADFLWFDVPRAVNGVQLGGRREPRARPVRRERLLERVLAPIAERYGRDAAIAGWDLLNEPEWATLGVGTLDPRRSISRREMREFLREAAAVVPRARDRSPFRRPRQPEVALPRRRRSPSTSSRCTGTRASTAVTTARAAGRGPRPPAGRCCSASSRRAGPRSGRARSSSSRGRPGYSGALAWSSLATDRATDALACHEALRELGVRARRPRRSLSRAGLPPRRAPPLPPAGTRPTPRADRRGRRPAPRAAPPRLLDGDLPLAGRAAPLALARPPHGAARRRAHRLPQPAPGDPPSALPAHPRHRLHRGDDRVRRRSPARPGRDLDHPRDDRLLHGAPPARGRPLGRGVARGRAGRRALRPLARARRSSASRCSRARPTPPRSRSSRSSSGSRRWGIPLVDCQVHTEHLASFGAREWPSRDFLAALHAALDRPTRLGPWRLDETP